MRTHQDYKLCFQNHEKGLLRIFTECSSQIGYGHLTRCISLYDECIITGLCPQFVLNPGAEDFIDILQGRSYFIGDWYHDPWKIAQVDSDHNSYAIVDSYIADIAVYEMIADGVRQQDGIAKAVYIDDTNRIEYPSGIIVNPSFFGMELNYKRKSNQVYLLGSEYIIMRKEFYNIPQELKRQRQQTKDNNIKNILIIMGGSDVKNLTPQIMDILSRSDEYKNCMQHVVIGKGFLNVDEIKKRKGTVKLYQDLNAVGIRDLMLRCDIAISAAGQTVYELMATGLPFICIKVIDNQENNIKGLLKYGAITEYFDFEGKTDLQIYDEITQLPNRINQALLREKNILICKGANNVIQELVK